MTSLTSQIAPHSGFLSLPTEIRCQIYDCILSEPQAITISAARTRNSLDRVRLHTSRKHIPGLPEDMVPVAFNSYERSYLLVSEVESIANVAGKGIKSGGNALGVPAPIALLLSCRLLYMELKDYMQGRQERKAIAAQASGSRTERKTVAQVENDEGLSLCVTYPYGVLVLKSMYPYLLRLATKVYITGYHKSAEALEPEESMDMEPERLEPSNSLVAASFGTPNTTRTLRHTSYRARRARNASFSARTSPYEQRPRLRLDPQLCHSQQRENKTQSLFPPLSSETQVLAPSALGYIVSTLLPPVPTQLVQLTTRILYPGGNSYKSAWTDEHSPACHIFRNICGGNISMEVKRRAAGTGLLLQIRPQTDQRSLSSAWDNRPSSSGRGRSSVQWYDSFLVGEE